MRIFVTGASGYIGNAVAKAFRAKGHSVHGLVRQKDDARLLLADEISPVVGDLEHPESYLKVLEDTEVVVHCAFERNSDTSVARDAKTIDAVLRTFSLSQLPRSFIYTSGIWAYGSHGDKMVDESMPLTPLDIVKWRPAHEEKVLKANSSNLRTVVIRPGVVYGGVEGLLPLMFDSADDGAVRIVGEGYNRWPMVHVQDLAHAYVSSAEKEIGGIALNVVDDSTATVREMAQAIARVAGIEGELQILTMEQAKAQYGDLAEGLALDLMVNNSRVKRILGWQIHHSPFLSEANIYYKAWKAAQFAPEF